MERERGTVTWEFSQLVFFLLLLSIILIRVTVFCIIHSKKKTAISCFYLGEMGYGIEYRF